MTKTVPILARQRQDLILERLKSEGALRVQDLATTLSVAPITVRRDLDALSQRGLIDKVHGGAALRDYAASEEPTFEAKSTRELAEKEAIARAAAGLVHPGSAIALSAGTTTLALARELLAIPNLTIVTNSMRIADLLTLDTRERRTVILVGGSRTPSDALVGPIAEMVIESLHVDRLFIGCHGVDPVAGLTTPNLAEAETNRHLVRCANQFILLADHTKWGVVGLSSFADLTDVNILVTDSGLDPSARAASSEMIGEIIVA